MYLPLVVLYLGLARGGTQIGVVLPCEFQVAFYIFVRLGRLLLCAAHGNEHAARYKSAGYGKAHTRSYAHVTVGISHDRGEKQVAGNKCKSQCTVQLF